MLKSIKNFSRGIEYKNLSKDISNHQNQVSLNNFIMYGIYSPKHNHIANKNKSISEVLELSQFETTILVNFIQIYNLNIDILKEKIEDLEEDNSFNDSYLKILVSLNNSPVELPMYFELSNSNEEIFYSELIEAIFTWINSYLVYCENYGVSEIQTLGLYDLIKFNGKLTQLKDKIAKYLYIAHVIYHKPEIIPDKDIETDDSSSDTTGGDDTESSENVSDTSTDENPEEVDNNSNVDELEI
jgi:hypothetical protein